MAWPLGGNDVWPLGAGGRGNHREVDILESHQLVLLVVLLVFFLPAFLASSEVIGPGLGSGKWWSQS